MAEWIQSEMVNGDHGKIHGCEQFHGDGQQGV